MRSVAIVDDPARARSLVGELPEYDATAVEPPTEGFPDEYDVVVVDWDRPVADRVAADRERRSWAVVAVVDGVPDRDPVGEGADGLAVRPVRPDSLRRVIDRVALQRAYLGCVNEATVDALPDDWHAAADDVLAALSDDLSYEELFRRLL